MINRIAKAGKMPGDLENVPADAMTLDVCDAETLPMEALLYQGGYLTIKNVIPPLDSEQPETFTRPPLVSDDVAKAAKLSAEEVQEALKKELEKDYVSKYKNAKPENYEENLEKTLSEDNLGKAMIYLGKDGKLTAICKEYASVGAGEFSVVLTLK